MSFGRMRLRREIPVEIERSWMSQLSARDPATRGGPANAAVPALEGVNSLIMSETIDLRISKQRIPIVILRWSE